MSGMKRKNHIIFTIFLTVPYLIGIVWHGLHPFVSIFTGRMNARKWYIDENSLDPSYLHMDVNIPIISKRQIRTNHSLNQTSLCLALTMLLSKNENQNTIPCYTYTTPRNRRDHFDIAKIQSVKSAIYPISESIVVVVPWSVRVTTTTTSNNNSYNNNIEINNKQIKMSVLKLINKLMDAPWLSKTIFIISPSTNTNDGTSLERTVDSFLSTYTGYPVNSESNKYQWTSGHNRNNNNINDFLELDLPPLFEGSIVRNVLVLDFEVDYYVNDQKEEENSNNNNNNKVQKSNELRILPQGRWGTLPNMDLPFATMFIYSHSKFLSSKKNGHHPPTYLVMHPYRSKVQQFIQRIESSVLTSRLYDQNPFLQQKLASARNVLVSLFDFLAFEYTMVMNSNQPHATALDYGIDSLTIQGYFSGGDRENNNKIINEGIGEIIQKMEYLLRSLSNLQERLHHSTTLYLLPTPEKFVKHEEYLVPNLLLLLPFIARGMYLIFVGIEQLDLQTMFKVLVCSVSGAVVSDYLSEILPVSSFTDHDIVIFVIAYTMAIGILYHQFFHTGGSQSKKNTTNRSRDDTKYSVQVVACLMGLVLHVILAFGHVSLSFPSALFWVPLLSYPPYIKTKSDNTLQGMNQSSKEHTINKGKKEHFLHSVYVWLTTGFLYALPLCLPYLGGISSFWFSTYFCFHFIPLHLAYSLMLLL